MNRVSSPGAPSIDRLQVLVQSRSITASKLARSWPPSGITPNSLDYGLQVYLQTRSITACKCNSELARLRPPSSHEHGLQVHLQTRSILASKCISEFTRSTSPSASLSSLDLRLQVHLCVHSISVSKCISNTLDQVHLQGATAVLRRYRGNGGGQSDGEYTTITASEYNRLPPVQI